MQDKQRLKGTNQRGVTLIAALVAAAIISFTLHQIVTLTLNNANRVHIKRANDQNLLYLFSSENLIFQMLDSAEDDAVGRDIMWELLRGHPIHYPIDEFSSISIQIADQHQCLNVNRFAGEEALANSFERLLSTAIDNTRRLDERVNAYRWNLDLSKEEFIDRLADWIDEDSQVRRFGAETPQYLGDTPQRLAANELIASMSEINHLYPLNYTRLLTVKESSLPPMCALPTRDNQGLGINTINRASLPILASILSGVTTPERVLEWYENEYTGQIFTRRSTFVESVAGYPVFEGSLPPEFFSGIRDNLSIHPTYINAFVTITTNLNTSFFESRMIVSGDGRGVYFRSELPYNKITDENDNSIYATRR